MDQEGSFPRANQMNPSRRPKALIILIVFLLVLSVIIYLGTRFLGTGSEEEVDEAPTPVIEATSTPEPTQEEEPTPTGTESESDDLDRADAAIQILNGSGISGAAGSMSAVLKSAGWSDITTGNADSFDFEDVSISVTKESAGFLPMLEEDLEDDYTIGDTDTDLASTTYDAVITIGK